MGWQDEEEIEAQREFQTEVYLDKMRMVFIRAAEVMDDKKLSAKEAVAESIILLSEVERQTKEYENRSK
jgi:hypothetical protein